VIVIKILLVDYIAGCCSDSVCSVVCAHVHMQPIFLNEVMLRKQPEDDPDGTIFHLSHIEHLYSLRAPSTSERFVTFDLLVLLSEVVIFVL